MLRTAMKPKHLRVFAVMVVLVAAFTWLGNWQWAAAHNKASQKAIQQAAAQKSVPLSQVIQPQTDFPNDKSLHPITVSGRYDAAKTELVAGRVLNGKHGYWLMTPLIVDGTGARLPIVRGFVTQTTHLPAPPRGTVHISGALAPGESVSQLGDLPPGQIGTIDMGLLLNEWGGTVYNAFIFSTGQQPATAAQPGTASVAHIAPPIPRKTTVELRNAAYAFQWWIFAAFTVFMWFKTVRDDWKETNEQQSAVSQPAQREQPEPR